MLRVDVHAVVCVPAEDLRSVKSLLFFSPVSACGPWQLSTGQADEDFNEVVDDPGNDDIVVEPDANHNEEHRIANPWVGLRSCEHIIHGKLWTLEEGNDTPKGDGAAASVLAEGELEEEEGEAREDQVGEVGDEESP